jgi:hypothetical protein
MEMEATALKLEAAAIHLEVQASRVKEEAVMVARQADHRVDHQVDRQEAVAACQDGAWGRTNPWRRKGDNNNRRQ